MLQKFYVSSWRFGQRFGEAVEAALNAFQNAEIEWPATLRPCYGAAGAVSFRSLLNVENSSSTSASRAAHIPAL